MQRKRVSKRPKCIGAQSENPTKSPLIQVVVHRLRLVVLQIGQRSGFDADVEAPTAVEAEGDPREGHLPAVQVARDGDGRGGQFAVFEVVTALEGNTRLWRKVHRAVEADCLRDVALKARCAVVYIGDRVVDRVVEAHIPR